jgi:hypothetical protein
MVLRSKILAQSLKSDNRIVAFSNTQQSTDQQKELLEQAKNKYQSDEIKTAFQFSEMHNLSAEILEYLKKEKASFNTDAVQTFSAIQESITNIYQIGEKFQIQLNEILSNELLPEKSETLQVRIKAAANHFTKEMEKISTSIERIFIETDSKILATDLHKKLQKLYDEVCFKDHVIQGNVNGFSINIHLQHKRNFKKKTLSLKLYSGVTDTHSSNTPHADLYQMLKKKRDEICSEKNQPVYLVAKTATLNEMVLYLPQTITQLNTISGFGPVKSRQYGKAFLDIICAYCEEHQISSTVFESNDLPIKTKKPTAVKAEKKEKIDTKAISLNLYKSGKTIDEIAIERKMNTTTIEGHLSFYIQLGELDITEIVTSEKIKMIKAALEKHGFSSLKSIKENLPENIGYGELKMVMAAENQQVEN